MNRLRKLAFFTALPALLALLAAAAWAQSVPSPESLKPTGFVNDYAHVLAPAAARQLEQAAEALNQRLRVQVAMVTVKTIGDHSAFLYSYKLAEHWGVGAKTAANGQDHDTGLLIFLAVNDHKYFTQIGYGMEPYITDADVGSWMRALKPQLEQKQFGVVFATMLGHIEQTLAARMPGAAQALSQMPSAGQTAQGQGYGQRSGSPLPLVILLIVIWGVGAFVMRGRGGMGGCLWPLLLFDLLGGFGGGGGYGGRGGWGGGFGGGGGGFGGFGGGGFGGGGAGGSW